MEIEEAHQGFRKGRRMMGGMFMLRQLVKKRLEVQGEMALGYVDLEKALQHCSERDGDGDTEMDGNAGSRSQDDGRDVQGNEGKSFVWFWDV